MSGGQRVNGSELKGGLTVIREREGEGKGEHCVRGREKGFRRGHCVDAYAWEWPVAIDRKLPALSRCEKLLSPLFPPG